MFSQNEKPDFDYDIFQVYNSGSEDKNDEYDVSNRSCCNVKKTVRNMHECPISNTFFHFSNNSSIKGFNGINTLFR